MSLRTLAARAAYALVLCLAAATAWAAPAKAWTFTILPGFNGDASFAEGVSNAGVVGGWSSYFDPAINSNRTQAAVWQNGTRLDLGEGSVVAVSRSGTMLASVAGMGGLALWKNGEWQRLGLVAVGMALNNSDHIAGWHTVAGWPRAFFFRDGVMFDLGTLGGASSSAEAVNEHDQVVGYAKAADNNDHAFLWEDGVMKDLGTLGGGRVSRAHAINNRGVVVGEAWAANGAVLPFIYDGVMRPLFTGASVAVPNAINERGDVVGTLNGSGSFLYADGVVTRLEDIPAVRAAGIAQLLPTGINDRGWIVGYARPATAVPPGHMPWRAFILKP